MSRHLVLPLLALREAKKNGANNVCDTSLSEPSSGPTVSSFSKTNKEQTENLARKLKLIKNSKLFFYLHHLLEIKFIMYENIVDFFCFVLSIFKCENFTKCTTSNHKLF